MESYTTPPESTLLEDTVHLRSQEIVYKLSRYRELNKGSFEEHLYSQEHPEVESFIAFVADECEPDSHNEARYVVAREAFYFSRYVGIAANADVLSWVLHTIPEMHDSPDAATHAQIVRNRAVHYLIPRPTLATLIRDFFPKDELTDLRHVMCAMVFERTETRLQQESDLKTQNELDAFRRCIDEFFS